MKKLTRALILCCLMASGGVSAREYHDESTEEHKKKSDLPDRLTIGGYGEVALQRMFYSDNVARYTHPDVYRNDSHGRFDLPHVVIFLSYDFGKGWKMSSELEYEHGGTGSTYEIENSEAGEYETEIEKGGEVAFEQFWIEKSWNDRTNLRAGHIVVPVGLMNQHHLPTEFFSVIRPEGGTEIIPNTWHQTGISFWGRTRSWRYEAQFISGLDAERFNNANWVKGGANSPYEFEIANRYAGVLRIDNYSVKGLRLGLSGYYGQTAQNTLKQERYQNIKGNLAIGSLDFTYNANNILARGNFLYGHLGDSKQLSNTNKKLPSASPSPRTDIASDAMSYFAEVGYDLLSFFPGCKHKEDKLYVFGHYGFYDPMKKTESGVSKKKWTKKTVISGGVNYFPMDGLVVKAEYQMRKLNSPYNNEPTLSIGVAYAGLFGK
ncbi:MAG: hypothetical protein LBG18_04965 [Mediterranea sp.]|jgi:hypothetical protein|nr:hypothetical protein [Mediterranea sp.]